ncbi:hypothetical protein K438DRAFT_1775135 [Mycena galopus ATCC 62051]|nr:hypothetical protein K438DRAFT_1775135 [Mycena galopus ATCC 62051]
MVKDSTRVARRNGRAQKSFRVRTVLGVLQPNGTIQHKVKTLGRRGQEEMHLRMDQEVREHINGLMEERHQQFLALQEGRVSDSVDDMDDFVDEPMTAEDILQLGISHGGGELQAELGNDMHTHTHTHKPKRYDTRTRKDGVQRRVLGFRGQMKAITDAYIKWGATQGQYGLNSPPAPPPAAEGNIDGVYSLKVVDMFSTYIVHAPMHTTDKFIVSSLVGQGLFC